MSTHVYENGAYEVSEPPMTWYPCLWSWLRTVHLVLPNVTDQQIIDDNFAVVVHGHILAAFVLTEGRGWIAI